MPIRAAEPRPAAGIDMTDWRILPEGEWDRVRGPRTTRLEELGMGALRITLLFGSAAIALALIAVPLLDSRINGTPGGIDYTSTGSISRAGIYTLHRSVLQPTPNSVCVIRQDGTRRGDC
jgi:hypothetical protein